MALRLDAFGQHGRARAFHLGKDPVHRSRDILVRPALNHRQVELDDIGPHQRHHGQAGRLGSDVVDRDANAGGAGGSDSVKHRGGIVGEIPLGEFDHDIEIS